MFVKCNGKPSSCYKHLRLLFPLMEGNTKEPLKVIEFLDDYFPEATGAMLCIYIPINLKQLSTKDQETLDEIENFITDKFK
jgi:hypothetical protein